MKEKVFDLQLPDEMGATEKNEKVKEYLMNGLKSGLLKFDLHGEVSLGCFDIKKVTVERSKPKG